MSHLRRWRFLKSRRAPFFAVLVVALSCALPAHGQKDKVHRVAYISVAPMSDLKGPGRSAPIRTFVNRLGELGYIEGRNLHLDFYTLEGRFERIPAVLSEIVRSKANVIFSSNQPVVSDQNLPATAGIPVVMLATWNIAASGAAQTLARPGGSVTGFIVDVDEAVEAKRLELLREAIPRVKRVAYLAGPTLWDSPAGKRVRDATQRLGLSVFHAAYDGSDIQDGFAAIEREKPDAVFVPAGSTTFAHRQRIGEFVVAKRLPCIAGAKEIVESGCLMSYGVDVNEILRNAAGYVAKILEGAKPGDLPIQQPTKFELVVNMKAAKVLGIKIPQSILLRADRVIE